MLINTLGDALGPKAGNSDEKDGTARLAETDFVTVFSQQALEKKHNNAPALQNTPDADEITPDSADIMPAKNSTSAAQPSEADLSLTDITEADGRNRQVNQQNPETRAIPDARAANTQRQITHETYTMGGGRNDQTISVAGSSKKTTHRAMPELGHIYAPVVQQGAISQTSANPPFSHGIARSDSTRNELRVPTGQTGSSTREFAHDAGKKLGTEGPATSHGILARSIVDGENDRQPVHQTAQDTRDLPATRSESALSGPTSRYTSADAQTVDAVAKPPAFSTTDFLLGNPAEDTVDLPSVYRTDDASLTRPSQQPVGALTTSTAVPGAQVRSIAAQMAETTLHRTEGTFEITLTPEELGRVKITITPADGRLTLMVIAERAETLDLIRRHADELNQAFDDIGYSERSFEFSHQAEDQKQADRDAEKTQPVMMSLETEPSHPLQPVALSGVDLRI